MPLLQIEAERLSTNEFTQGIVETIITEDPLYNLLDFQRVNGKALVYNRELALPTTQFRAPGDTIPESSGKTEEVIARIRAIIGDVDVDNFLDETMSNEQSQEAIQIAMKVKATSRSFRDNFINGTAYTGTITAGNPAGFITAVKEVSDAAGKGNHVIELDVSATSMRLTANGDTEGPGPWVNFTTVDGDYVLKSGSPARYVKVTVDASALGASDANIVVTATETKGFTGLKSLVVPGQTILAGANGAALSFDLMDQLYDAIKGVSVDAILMNKRTIRAYKALLRTAGGTDSAMMQLPNFGAPVLTFNGKPILPSEFIHTDETAGSGSNLTSVYAVSLDPTVGLHALYGGAEAGIRVTNIGELEDKDATRTRVKWYCGSALRSEVAVARLAGITN